MNSHVARLAATNAPLPPAAFIARSTDLLGCVNPMIASECSSAKSFTLYRDTGFGAGPADAGAAGTVGLVDANGHIFEVSKSSSGSSETAEFPSENSTCDGAAFSASVPSEAVA
jgi:hypothetical protein